MLHPEEAAGIVAAELPELFGLHAAGGRHMAYGEDREGGLVALAAPGHGRKVGAVGLQQQAVVRDDGQGLTHGLVGRVADRSGDGDVPAVADDAPGHVGIAAKTVPEQRIADKTAGFESHEGLGLGVAAMDDHRLFQLAGQLQLIVQDLVLDLLGAVVPVEIEPDLAHGAQAVIHGKGFTDVRKDFGRALLSVTGVDAQHEKDLGMCIEIAAATAPAASTAS